MPNLKEKLYEEISSLNEEDIKKVLEYVQQFQNVKTMQKKTIRKALLRLKRLKGILKSAYPNYTSVELQHNVKELW